MKYYYIVCLSVCSLSCQEKPCDCRILYGDELFPVAQGRDIIMPRKDKARLLDGVKRGDSSSALTLSGYNAAMLRPEAAYYWAKKALELGSTGITKKDVKLMERRIYEVESEDSGSSSSRHLTPPVELN